MKRLLPLLALAALASTLAACGGGGGSNNTTSTQSSNIPNPIVFCVDTTYPPAESIVNGKPAGYDIDIANAVAKQLGSTAAPLPERLARLEMCDGFPFFTIRKAPTSTYGTKWTCFARSGVTVIELMIALHFLCKSEGMITVKPVVLICAVEPSCFAMAFAMSLS